LGINKTQSSRWQREARVPDEVFNRYLAWAQDEGKEVTAAGLLRLAREWESRSTECPMERRRGNRSKSMIVDSIALPPAEEPAMSMEVRELIGGLYDHHRELTKQLVEYCGQKRLDWPELAKRHYVGQLLREMDEMFATVSEALGVETG
jgi:hypothetical protein